jgi:hypothetical protein
VNEFVASACFFRRYVLFNIEVANLARDFGGELGTIKFRDRPDTAATICNGFPG